MEPQKNTILVVDDELSIRESFALILQNQYHLLLVASGEAALNKIAEQKVDLVLLDVRMPGLNGLETLERIRSLDKTVPVILVTAVNDVGKAAEATKIGAQDYLIKPFNVNQILNLVSETLRKKSLSREAKRVRQEAEEKHLALEIIGQTDKMNLVKESAARAAEENLPVFVAGAIGTEKEILANLIHHKSNRTTNPFITLNIEKDLSLYQARQIFSGTKTGQSTLTLGKEAGLLEKANHGTLFLNNIELLPLSFQKELAGILKSGRAKEAETGLELALDISIITASNHHPKELLKNKVLNHDLYKEISQFLIEIPPLKSRSTDIPLLVTEWLEKINQKYSLEIKGFTKDALDALSAYSWPGNLAELISTLESIALATASEFISVEELPLNILLSSPVALSSKESESINQEAILSRFIKTYIEKLLEKNKGDKTTVASVLGLTPTAFKIKTESLGIKA